MTTDRAGQALFTLPVDRRLYHALNEATGRGWCGVDVEGAEFEGNAQPCRECFYAMQADGA